MSSASSDSSLPTAPAAPAATERHYTLAEVTTSIPNYVDKQDRQLAFLIDSMFFAARNITFSLPKRHADDVMKSMMHHILDRHNNGTQECKRIIYDAYEKWAGEPYESESDSD
jgi:hypothetical protein